MTEQRTTTEERTAESAEERTAESAEERTAESAPAPRLETESLAPVGRHVLLESTPGAVHTRAVKEAWERLGFHVTAVNGADTPEPPDVYCVVALGNEALGSRASASLRRAHVARVLEGMARRGDGRAVLVTDAGPHVHDDAEPECAAERAADHAWWQHLAKRCATQGVLANTVRVGYAPFLGHELTAEAEGELLRHLVTRRPVTTYENEGEPPPSREELERLSLPFTEDKIPSDSELRVAQAQLVGWLEGLFHGIQATLFAQQMEARQQLEELRQRGLPPGGDGAGAPARPGTYL